MKNLKCIFVLDVKNARRFFVTINIICYMRSMWNILSGLIIHCRYHQSREPFSVEYV